MLHLNAEVLFPFIISNNLELNQSINLHASLKDTGISEDEFR